MLQNAFAMIGNIPVEVSLFFLSEELLGHRCFTNLSWAAKKDHLFFEVFLNVCKEVTVEGLHTDMIL